MPLLPSTNHFALLSIELNISIAIVDTMPEVISPSSDVQTPPPAKVSARNTLSSTCPHIPAWERHLPHHYVVASTSSTNSLKLQVEIETMDTQQIQSVAALLDSGATGLFLNTDYVQQHCLTTHPLSRPIPVYNVDGMLNETGSICSVVDLVLCYQDHSDPPPLAFPYREAFYEDVQGVGCESPEEEEGGGEWTHTPDAEYLDENIERFIQNFSHHAQPLFDLTVKNTAWLWEPPQQAAFDAIKQSMTSKPVLLLPDDDSPFCVEADSSDFAIGAVLSQQSKEYGKWHPVAFYSKSLNAVERNYEIHDKEMLWSLYLANFDFSLHHKLGQSMGKPDALSRQADHGTGAGDNYNIVLLKPELFAIHALEGIVAQGDEANILRDIQQGNQEGAQEDAVAQAA
ncbi:hypothetical protein E4T56_gene7985 [Termitomyces sp. T112]|nr:hypothetical protein E4T56_gene7985 [Termitomyces sp. T112]